VPSKNARLSARSLALADRGVAQRGAELSGSSDTCFFSAHGVDGDCAFRQSCSRRMRELFWSGLGVSWLLLGCTDHVGAVAPARVVRTAGSAVALSRDERIAVVTNRSAGSVSVFSISAQNGQTQAKILRSFDTGAGSEPWASVISRDDDTAYVLFRNSETVRRLTGLHGTPAFEATGVSVGTEPTAIALSPSGKKLFVANFGDGTVSVITTADFSAALKIDLNHALVNTGVLGTVTSRAALAHPRALALTDNGDDDDLDETLYVTEFFSQPLPGVPPESDWSEVDRNRQGFVYPVSMKTGQPGVPISIAPVPVTGFADATGQMTSCFPNQLYAAAVDSERLYVTSMCTSPRGPLGPGPANADGTAPSDQNFKTLFHPAVFVVDTRTDKELPALGRLLSKELEADYQREDPALERMPLIPNEVTFGRPGMNGAQAYVTALGADALYRLDYDDSGVLKSIGDPGARYIDVKSSHGLPVGVAVSRASSPAFALVVTDAKLRLSIVDLASNNVSYVDAYADPTVAKAFRESPESQGRGFFGTGRDLWSLKGQAWSSCEGCHPGGLSDGVTWYFARGPRRTLSTAGSYDKRADVSQRSQRLLLWGANIDELHDIEAIVRGVSGGVGAVLWTYSVLDDATNECRLLYDGSPTSAASAGPCPRSMSTTFRQNGLNGSLSALDTGSPCLAGSESCDRSRLPDWQMIDRYIRAQRAPHAPSTCPKGETVGCLPAPDVDAGRQLFEQGRCAGCHGGPGWTVSQRFYQPGADQNGELPYNKPTTPEQAALAQPGALCTSTYSVPREYLALNPAASAGSGSGMPGYATFRNPIRPVPAVPVTPLSAEAIDAAYTNATDDQIRCALRAVGTFPDQTVPTSQGIFPAGAPPVIEVRQDMKSLAQGASGFNVPSLFGLSLGAPYFHAGNARTLEELFEPATFTGHHQALVKDFLAGAAADDARITQLVAFLLSIQEDTPLASDADTGRLDFCRQ